MGRLKRILGIDSGLESEMNLIQKNYHEVRRLAAKRLLIQTPVRCYADSAGSETPDIEGRSY
jgi:hypothetical protein